MHELWELRSMQAAPLSVKVALTKSRIQDWVRKWGEDGVYVSFSGGKDSTVLLHIARSMYPNMKAVFSDTGLEYPEIREFVKSFDNVDWVKPHKVFKQVVEEYGYPFISKEVSGKVAETRNWLDRHGMTWKSLLTDRQTDRQTDSIKCAPQIADFLGIERRGEAKNSKEYQRLKMGIIPSIPIRTQYMMGIGKDPNTGKLSPFNSVKWAFLIDSPYKFSNKCCDEMKKKPMKKYARETGRHPITAQMAEESRLRQSQWMRHGCNMYDAKNPISNHMSFWTEQDIFQYIKQNNIEICSVYGDIVIDGELDGQMHLSDISSEFDMPKMKTTGCTRTGCMFCGYGCHLEKGEGRFERMKRTHPKVYDYIMRTKDEGGLDFKNVIDWINENGNTNIKY